MAQSVRSSVWDMMRTQPSPMEGILIQPSAPGLFRAWQPAADKRIPPPR